MENSERSEELTGVFVADINTDITTAIRST
jgi:hypothetical protein